jgi:hypothetical protein
MLSLLTNFVLRLTLSKFFLYTFSRRYLTHSVWPSQIAARRTEMPCLSLAFTLAPLDTWQKLSKTCIYFIYLFFNVLSTIFISKKEWVLYIFFYRLFLKYKNVSIFKARAYLCQFSSFRQKSCLAKICF